MNKPVIFIGGAGRSGTTLLRVILDSHPNIACGPELKVTEILASVWYDFQTKYTGITREYDITQEDTNRLFAGVIEGLLEKYRIREDKERIAEKSPNNIHIFPHLHEMFPDSPLVHMIRDGRDVVSSLLSMDWKNINGEPMEYTRDTRKAAQFWKRAITKGRRFAAGSTSAAKVYYEIRYEDVVREPEKTLKGLFRFIDEPWDPVVLEYYRKERNLAGESSAGQVSQKLFTSSMGRWKNDLSTEQKKEVRDTVGDLLVELGYTKDLDW